MSPNTVKDGGKAPAGPRRKHTAAPKRLIVAFLKFAVPAAIIIYLLVHIDQQQWRELRERTLGPRQWLSLGAAFALTLSLVVLTMFRWWLLVRALELPFRLRDAFRLGFLAYLLNFVSVGSVGGDLFKALFIAREQPGRRAVAAATVLVDRVVGVSGLLIVATLALMLGEIPNPTPELAAIRRLTFLAAGIGALAILAMFAPGFTAGSLAQWAADLPKVGPTLGRLFAAARMYRSRPGVMTACVAMSVVVHLGAAVVFCLLARALFAAAPTLTEHLMIAPLANVAGALPFTPAGLGALEAAMEYLYARLPDPSRAGVPGVTVALAYRLVTIGIATVGAAIYWTSRREVRDVMVEAEKEMADQA